MRGKQPAPCRRVLHRGITPADAGKTALMPDGGAVKWDHPRGCGENRRIAGQLEQLRGSPPRMRGKRPTRLAFPFLRGITPADAGKTRRQVRKRTDVQDHPRGCGENLTDRKNAAERLGSPPRMRGKRLDGLASAPTAGITPADAGKTASIAVLIASRTDHPRGCGENLAALGNGFGGGGSPPRMRGKPLFSALGGNNSRITPADAGKTLKRSFRNQPFCSRAVQISFNFSNSLNVSLQSGSAR